jgi:hypothetical protein
LGGGGEYIAKQSNMNMCKWIEASTSNHDKKLFHFKNMTSIKNHMHYFNNKKYMKKEWNNITYVCINNNSVRHTPTSYIPNLNMFHIYNTNTLRLPEKQTTIVRRWNMCAETRKCQNQITYSLSLWVTHILLPFSSISWFSPNPRLCTPSWIKN